MESLKIFKKRWLYIEGLETPVAISSSQPADLRTWAGPELLPQVWRDLQRAPQK